MTKARLKYLFWEMAPFLLAVFLVLLKSLPFQPFGFSQSYLSNVYAVVFYCAVFNAGVVNVFSVFFLGCITDIVLDTPVGLSPFLYCSAFFVGRFYRRYLRQASFGVQWLIYTVLCVGIYVFGLILLKIMYHTVPHLGALTAECLVLIGSYPIWASVVGYMNREVGRYIG